MTFPIGSANVWDNSTDEDKKRIFNVRYRERRPAAGSLPPDPRKTTSELGVQLSKTLRERHVTANEAALWDHNASRVEP